MGVVRHRAYAGPDDLAQAVAAALPGGCTRCIADIRVRNGELLITSREHLVELQARGRLFCRDCGRFFLGEKGLRDHQLVKHKQTYQRSKAAVAEAKAALVLYSSPALPSSHAATPIPGSLGVHPGVRPETARASLDEGLCAARDGDLAALRHLVNDKGWDAAGTRDRNGSSALLWAAGGGHLHVCRYLVDELGVDALARQARCDCRNALHWAARNGRLEVVRWLVEEQKLDVNEGTLDGTTPFHFACYQGHEECCRLLLGLGAHASTLNRFGCNAMQWAGHSGNVRMCRFLVSVGVDPGRVNNNGHSAIHKAALKGQRHVCQYFLDEAGLGPEHMREDGAGHTPAELARLEGHDALARWLDKRAVALLGGASCDLSPA